MKKTTTFLLITMAILLLAACSSKPNTVLVPDTPEPTPELIEAAPNTDEEAEVQDTNEEEASKETTQEVPRFITTSPVVPFTEDEILGLGVNCEGSEQEVAQCIKSWQETNMLYCQDTDLEDCSDVIRANYVLPGLYTSQEMIKTRQQNGRVYGICFDYAVIYCSIAEYHGLECRVVNSISKPSERPGANVPITHGMAEEEYVRWNDQLKTKGVDYSYDVLRLIARETPEHYWAEVNLDGNWTVLDATRINMGGNTETEYIQSGDFELTDWFASDSSQQAYDYAVRIASGEDLRNEGYDSVGEQFLEGREVASAYGDAANYTGIEDSLGQTGRSGNMEDFMQGYGLMPFLPTCQDACAFLGAPEECYEDCEEENEILTCYESCSGDPYYFGCIYLESGMDDTVNPEAYEACAGIPLNMSCEETCAGE